MHESHACGLKTSISCIKDNFSRRTQKSGWVILKQLHFISDLLCIISLLFITIAKAFKFYNLSVQRLLEHLQTFFGNVRKSSENRRKSSEVARTFLEIPIVTRQQPHAFDSEKVGRYNLGMWKQVQKLKLTRAKLWNQNHHFITCCSMHFSNHFVVLLLL